MGEEDERGSNHDDLVKVLHLGIFFSFEFFGSGTEVASGSAAGFFCGWCCDLSITTKIDSLITSDSSAIKQMSANLRLQTSTLYDQYDMQQYYDNSAALIRR